MIAIAALLARWGLSERIAKVLAPFAAVLAALALLAALWGAWRAFDWLNDRQAVKSHEIEREAQAGRHRETAAAERLGDALKDAGNEEDLHDAIDKAPRGGQLSPHARALNCERLRKLGRIPPACGPAGGDGSQAATE